MASAHAKTINCVFYLLHSHLSMNVIRLKTMRSRVKVAKWNASKNEKVRNVHMYTNTQLTQTQDIRYYTKLDTFRSEKSLLSSLHFVVSFLKKNQTSATCLDKIKPLWAVQTTFWFIQRPKSWNRYELNILYFPFLLFFITACYPNRLFFNFIFFFLEELQSLTLFQCEIFETTEEIIAMLDDCDVEDGEDVVILLANAHSAIWRKAGQTIIKTISRCRLTLTNIGKFHQGMPIFWKSHSFFCSFPTQTITISIKHFKSNLVVD